MNGRLRMSSCFTSYSTKPSLFSTLINSCISCAPYTTSPIITNGEGIGGKTSSRKEPIKTNHSSGNCVTNILNQSIMTCMLCRNFFACYNNKSIRKSARIKIGTYSCRSQFFHIGILVTTALLQYAHMLQFFNSPAY